MVRLDLESIDGLIDNKIEESQILDYKKELTSNKEIAKDVSAFANTSGGKIIYGVDEINGIPILKNWIDSKGVIERIENVILTNIRPKIKGHDIYSIENPENPSLAIFIVDIPESTDAPHMVEVDYYRYFIRRQRKSEPMVDSEVKIAIFRKGLRKALEHEVKQNLKQADENLNCLSKYMGQWSPTSGLAPPLLIPFYTEAWRAVVGSGILFISKDETILVEAYNIIHEINYLIDSLRYEKYSRGAYTPSSSGTPAGGNWIQPIIQRKIEKLKNVLQEIKFN